MRNHKMIFISLLVVLALTAIGALAAYSYQSGITQAKERMKEVQAPATEKQKKHGKLLKQSQGRRLRELTASGTGDITITAEEPFIIYTEPPRSPALQTIVCNAEAIVAGVINDGSPQLTEDESFLFTEYTMTVEKVVKDNAAVPIQIGTNISVVRDGGEGRINGRTIHAKVEGFKSFEVGKRYILFLRFIPETDSYLAYANGSFELSEEKIIPLGKLKDQPKDEITFLNAVHTIVSSNDCINQRGQK